jgi:exodeoxyribonuclease VII large subunit
MKTPPPGPNAKAANPFDLFARPAARAPNQVRIWSVGELTRELKSAVEARFAQVAVRGEVSNLRPAASGHLYFTLKDEGACLSAVLFRAEGSRLKFKLRDGLSLIARGRISVYEARGQYQLICDALEPEGAGALALAFEQLKAKLLKEGLFDPRRKRKVPFLPRRIGLVTSPSGAALHDFLRVLHDRHPIPVLLAAARVQGEGAAEEIARAIARLGAAGGVDVIVVTRGGGSIEDLWAFNEEIVARAIAAAPVPVVSAVGHEVDVTIADFAADLRCATPTDAAKTLAPPRLELARALDQQRRHLAQIAGRLLLQRRERLQARSARLPDPRRRVERERLQIDHRLERAERSLRRALAERRERLKALAERLSSAHPRARLSRIARELSQAHHALGAAARARLGEARARLDRGSQQLVAQSPATSVVRGQRRLALLRERCEKAAERALARERLRLSRASAGLDSLSPLRVLGRGYAVAFAEGRRVLTRAADAPPGSRIGVLLSDQSEIEAEVLGARPPAR